MRGGSAYRRSPARASCWKLGAAAGDFALKIWRERSELEFPSFLLELATLRALENERFGQLAENVHCVLRYLGSKFESAVIRDPANSDNIVSRDLSEKAKKSIAKAARDAIYQENWEKILH